MRIILQQGEKYVLRFDRGEDVLDNLRNFCEAEKIQAGFFTGLGATQEIILSYYNLDGQKYTDLHFPKNFEIINLTGNIAVIGDKPVIHAHGSFSDLSMHTSSGHVKRLIASATCEIILHKIDGKIEREFSQEIGLNLMK